MEQTDARSGDKGESQTGQIYELILEDLPAFPPLAARLASVAAQPDAAIDEVVDLLRSDGALSAELLRRANSAAYGFSSRIDTLQKALVLLGFDELRRIALACAAKGFMGPALQAPELRLCWRHSLAVGLLAEDLARGTPIARERAYTAGVLHDIGRLGLFTARPELFCSLLAEAAVVGEIEDSSYFLHREAEVFGCDHTAAGRWLAENWAMPADLQAVAGRHHDRPSGGDLDLLALIQFCVTLADALGFGVVSSVARREIATLAAQAPAQLRESLERDGAELEELLKARIDALDGPMPDEAEPDAAPDPESEDGEPLDLGEADGEPPKLSQRVLLGAMAVMALLGALLVLLAMRG